MISAGRSGFSCVFRRIFDRYKGAFGGDRRIFEWDELAFDGGERILDRDFHCGPGWACGTG